MATITGTRNADTLNGGAEADTITGRAGNDTITAGGGDDTIDGGRGDDQIDGGTGVDTAILDVDAGDSDQINLGAELTDNVRILSATGNQVRLTFTSAEVGNGAANDGGNPLNNQDGGLGVRVQGENSKDGLTGDISRTDDEGMIFVATGATRFDVRDLVSGAARGDDFQVVWLGTQAGDSMTVGNNARNYYFNAGAGNDTVAGGDGNDFLVGGAGDDTLNDEEGNDTALGGAGNDVINLGQGNDQAIFNISTDGADSINTGAGDDVLLVSAAAGTTQVRLTFTSSEIGNGVATDAGTMMNQDGGLAVRVQAEGPVDNLTGSITRTDDEGVTFVSTTPGLTFDVRDLPTGTARGDLFEVVTLGTLGGDNQTAVQAGRSYYFNAGMGNDTVTGGFVNDFLVGGAGDDQLFGERGDDSFLGGGGRDLLIGGNGLDRLEGGDGDDRIDGRNDADTLLGQAGTDRLRGGTGADTITGGANGDLLVGGAGADVFVFTAASDSTINGPGRDSIGDFNSVDDTIDIRALGVTDFEEQVLIVTRPNGVSLVFIDLDNDGQFDDFGFQSNGDRPVEADFLLA